MFTFFPKWRYEHFNISLCIYKLENNRVELKKSSSECSGHGKVLHCKCRNQSCKFCRRQVFHCKLGNQGCSSAQNAGLPLQTRELGLQFFPNAGLHCKLRNQDCSSAKGRFSTANSGTKIAVLPKAGLPLQTQEPRLQVYQG